MKKLLSVLAVLAVSAVSFASDMKTTSGENKEMPATTSGQAAN